MYPDGSKVVLPVYVIKEKLAKHKEIQLLELEEVEKKDIQKKSEIVNQSDLVILCLPDASAKETVSLVKVEFLCVWLVFLLLQNLL